jgi:O-antigen ligase
LLWVVLSSRWIVTRLAVLPLIAYGMYVVLTTGSRGAALGLVVEVAIYLLLGTTRQRIALLTAGAVIVGLVISVAPKAALDRIMTTFSNEADTRAELAAINSRLARQELIWKAIDYTLQHPLVGVGPGQMSDVNGRSTKTSWQQGVWQNAHNSFLQASSECGIPAMIFLTAGYFSTWLRLRATHRKARRRPDCQDIRTTAFCLMIGMAGFSVSAFFLNFAYLFYAPAMAGLAIAVSSAAGREFEVRSAATKAPEAAAPALPLPSARWAARS